MKSLFKACRNAVRFVLLVTRSGGKLDTKTSSAGTKNNVILTFTNNRINVTRRKLILPANLVCTK